MTIQTNKTSNHPHPLPFVVQGFDSTTGQWHDSKHGGLSPQQAASNFPCNAAMPRTRLRVVSRKEAAQ